MKTLKNNSRIFVVALATLFSVTLTSSANAADTKGTDPVTVQYIGKADNMAMFQLSLSSETETKYEISISDKFSTIYYDKVKGKEVVRNFQFYSTDTEAASVEDEILIVITNTVTKEVTTYKVLPNATPKKESGLVAKL